MGSRESRSTKRASRRVSKHRKSFCSIPIPAAVSNYSNSNDFYTWVNNDWLEKVHVPSFENDFGASEEVERCIFNISMQIIEDINPKTPGEKMLKQLADSSLHNNSQYNSVDFLQSILKTLICIHTKEDVMKHFAEIASASFTSIFNLQYTVRPDKHAYILLNPDIPGLPIEYYNDSNKTEAYIKLLKQLGELLDIPGLEDIQFERNLNLSIESMWSSVPIYSKGSKLVTKFPKIPWATWFETLGISDWKQKTFYYNSPRWIRNLGKMLDEIPIDYWKIYIARTYIINALPYLPPPFNELEYDFFGRLIQGQKIKTPKKELLVHIVHDYMPDIFSEIFWNNSGSNEILGEMKYFTSTLVTAAKHRLAQTNWLKQSTRIAAIEKVGAMSIQIVRPSKWPNPKYLELDSKNLLKNIFLLGKWKLDIMLEREGHLYTFWEEGIYRVNAYYFNESNEILIPYGTITQPFYTSNNIPWNYGALGALIGHEMCHGFDEDGKDYSETGERKKWWTRYDNIAYNHKVKDLINLYGNEKVLGKHVNGKQTLSENIADLGGVGIALQALKEHTSYENRLKDYRTFFVAYATSWRTKYRDEKLKTSLETDHHSPAPLRVNLIVSQFDEWYEAFNIDSSFPFYRKPEDRIRIF